MPGRSLLDPQLEAAPFKRFKSVRRLGQDRSGHASVDNVRHQLYVGRDTETRANALIKVTTKPGKIYEQTLANEIATLETINRELPEARAFPWLWDHGRLGDGRVFLIMTLFDEWPLATTIGPERRPDRLVTHLRTALAVGDALAALHGIGVFHVDLNPMNVLYRAETDGPVIRIVDFESSYDRSRHAAGEFYNPPTTSGFCAPEVRDGAPDGRVDVFSLGAVLYTMMAGYGWTWEADAPTSIAADGEVDADLKAVLLAAVERDPARRCPSMPALHDALAAYLEAIWPGRPWSR